MSFFAGSIRSRLVLLSAAVLLPATLLVSWLIVQTYRIERRELERHLVGAVQATSQLIDASLAERKALLEGLGTSGKLQRKEWAAFHEQVKAMLKNSNEWIVLFDTAGQQLVNTKVKPDAVLPRITLNEEFKAAINRGETYVSNVTTGTVSGEKLIYIAIPLYEEGRLRYTIDMATTPAGFDPVLQQGGLAKGWTAAIVDRAGIVAARNRNADQFVGGKTTPAFAAAMAEKSEGVLEITNLEGIESIVAYTRSPKSGWTTVISAPAAELFFSAERLLMVTLSISLVCAAGALLLAWWIGRGVVTAVGTVVAGTDVVGRSELLTPQKTGMEETDFIFRALAETSSKLAAQKADLLHTNELLTATAARLREKQLRLDAARTAAATGTIVWHIQSRVFESDDSLNALLLMPAGTKVRSLEEFLSRVVPQSRAEVEERFIRSSEGETDLAVEFRIRRYDDVERWWLIRGKRFPEGSTGSGPYVAAACVDVTERKQSEAEVAQARDAAVAATRSKDRFLAALSHELRTPLNPVLLIASDAAERSDYSPEVREAFALIVKNTEIEARLIDDLLDITRVTQGKLALDLKPTDVHAVLNDAIETVRREIAEKHHTLDLSFDRTPIVVQGDGLRLQQVFWNVLKNAIKFTPAHGRIGLLTYVTAEQCEVQISDSGMGMTPEEIARCFNPFAQGDHVTDGRTHRFGGLGLGLSISRTLVELHGGVISVRSRGRGQGTTFTIRLPRSLTASGPSGTDASPVTAASSTEVPHTIMTVTAIHHSEEQSVAPAALTETGSLPRKPRDSRDAKERISKP